MAPPMPCSTRAATSCVNARDIAHANEPTLNSTTAATNTSRVPSRSDSQPDAGITIATARAYEATTACMRSGDSPRLAAIDGSAVLTIVVSSICMNAAVATSQSIGRNDGEGDACMSVVAVLSAGVSLDDLEFHVVGRLYECRAQAVCLPWGGQHLHAVGEHRLKRGAEFDLALEFRLHVFGAPPDVEKGRHDLVRWRLLHFVEEQPGTLSPHRIGATKRGPLTRQVRRVKLDRRSRIDRVQMNVMKVGLCKRRRGKSATNTQGQQESKDHVSAYLRNVFRSLNSTMMNSAASSRFSAA